MTETETTERQSDARLVAVTLDEASIGRIDPKIDHERQVAVFDLLEGNTFKPKTRPHDGPFRLHLELVEDRLVFHVENEREKELTQTDLSLVPFRRILKDYFLVLESYYKAVSEGQPSKIEAIDVGRRGLHDEASRMLQDRLADKIEIDFETARRFFTLLTALHWKG